MTARPVFDVEERREVIRRFARLHECGRPVFCRPSPEELSGEVRRDGVWGNDGKVVFDDAEHAEACARMLKSLGCEPTRAYRCKRGPHHHLTRDGAIQERDRKRRGAGRGQRRGARW